MMANEVVGYIALGGLLGLAGQGARAVVGLTKTMRSGNRIAGKPREKKRWFDGNRFAISLFIGAVAGMLGTVALWGSDIDRQFLCSVATFGYAGTDFIEGFMRQKA